MTEETLKKGSTDVHPNVSIRRRSQAIIEKIEKSKKSHENTKIILVQACAYLGAFFITLISPIIKSTTRIDPQWVYRMQICLIPLQGFLNCLIFIYHKIYSYQKLNPNAGTIKVLRKLLMGSEDVEVILFSRISMIDTDEDKNIVKVHVSNEFDDDEELSFVDQDGGSEQNQNNDNEQEEDNDEEKQPKTSHHVPIIPSRDIASNDLSGFDISFSS